MKKNNIMTARQNSVDVRNGPTGVTVSSVRRYTMQRTEQTAWLDNNMYDAERTKPEVFRASKAYGDQKPRVREKSRKLLKVLGITAIVITCLIPLLIASLVIKTDSFILNSDSTYSAEELADAAGIRIGDRMAGIYVTDAEKAIVEALPKIKSCKIKLSPGGSVSFEVEEYIPAVYFSVAGRYYCADSEMYIISSSDSDGDYKNLGLLEISAPGGSIAVEGSYYIPADGDCSYIGTFIEAAREDGIYDSITYVDFSDQYRISALTENGTKVHFGTVSDISEKVALARSVMCDKVKGEKVMIDVSAGGVAAVRTDS